MESEQLSVAPDPTPDPTLERDNMEDITSTDKMVTRTDSWTDIKSCDVNQKTCLSVGDTHSSIQGIKSHNKRTLPSGLGKTTCAHMHIHTEQRQETGDTKGG